MAGILDKIAKDKNSQRKGKQLIFPPHVAVNQTTISIAVVTTATIIEATKAIATITNLAIVIETTDAMITLDVTTRTRKAPSPTTRRMIASTITPRKRVMRPCIMTSPLRQALAIHPEKEVNLVQDLIHSLNLGLALAQVVRATTTIIKMIAS